MASEVELGSDSDDTRETNVPDRHKRFMKAKLIDYLSDVKNYSVKIVHTNCNEAQIVFSFSSSHGKLYKSQRADI